MYLFNRHRAVNPAHGTKAVEWAVAATLQAREITGKHIDAWVRVMSPEAGTVTWSFWDDTLADIEAAGDALAADPDFTTAAERADEYFTGPVDDRVYSMLHHTFTQGEHDKRYVTRVQATVAPGHLTDAFASGQALAEHATRVTGSNTAFVVHLTGMYNGVAWITGYRDIGEFEASERALLADPEWLDLVNRAGTDFNPTITRSLKRRLT